VAEHLVVGFDMGRLRGDGDGAVRGDGELTLGCRCLRLGAAADQEEDDL
jgi:hypothetical protein